MEEYKASLDDFSEAYYTAEYYDQYESTILSGNARIPICFCVDTSSSMRIIINDPSDCIVEEGTARNDDGGQVVSVRPKPGVKLVTRMEELQNVLSNMLQKMRQDEILSGSAAVCIVTFDQYADCYVEFTDLDRVHPNCPYQICVNKAETNAAKGLEMALDRLKRQQEMNAGAGNDSYRPVLIFLSDGNPTDGKEAERLRQEIRRRSEDGELQVIPVGIGRGIDERWLMGLSGENTVYHMNTDREFEKVFSEITRKIRRTTMVMAADEDDSEYLMAADVREDLPSTCYGRDHSEFLKAFLEA